MAKKQTSDLIDFRPILKEWKSKWYWFAISVVACVTLTLLWRSIQIPKYLVQANLLISQDQADPTSAMGGLASLFGGSGYVEDELFVVQSHSVLRQVVKDLQLNKVHIVKDGLLKPIFRYKDYPVEVFTDPAMADTLRGGVDFKVLVNEDGNIKVRTRLLGNKIITEAKNFPVTVETPYGKFVLNKTEYFVPGEELDTRIYFMGYDTKAEDLSEALGIEIASQKSNVIGLWHITTCIDFGKDLLNNLIAQYNIRGIQNKSAQGIKTTEFLDERLNLIVNDLSETEANVEKYKKDLGIIDVETEAKIGVTRKTELEEKIIELQTELEILKITSEFLNDPNNAYALIPMSGKTPESMVKSMESYNELILERMRLEASSKSNNSAFRTLSEQIDAVRKNLINSVDRTFDQQAVALNSLKTQVAVAQGKLSGIPEQERKYRDIMRQREVQEQLYLFLLQRREEAAMLAANSLPKGIVIDEPYALSEPVGMKTKMALALAFFFGLCIPPVILYARRAMRSQFQTREEVERLTDVPVLGEVCTARGENPLVVMPGGSSSAAELFRLIRTNLQFMLRNKGDKVVLVTSTNAGEGKSFVSINLAASLALLGKKVLLVGMDIRNPKLGEHLKIQPQKGLTQYLADPTIGVDALILKDAVAKNLDVIVAGPIPPNPSELLATQEVDKFISEVRDSYDYIIIDSAPVGLVTDTFVLDRVADATIYVTRIGVTKISDFNFINSTYEQGRLHNMSLVVNGTTTAKTYGYGHGHSEKKNKE